jgi:hypothetical protein
VNWDEETIIVKRKANTAVPCRFVRLLLGVVLVGCVWAVVGVTSALAVSPPEIHESGCEGRIGHTSIYINVNFRTGSEAQWRFEYSSIKGGPWSPVPGGSGTITQAEAEEAFNKVDRFNNRHAELTGLTPEVKYYVLATITNGSGSEQHIASSEMSCETRPFRPRAEMPYLRNPTAGTVRALGGVDPRGLETRWRFEVAKAESVEVNGVSTLRAPVEGSPAWQAVPGAEGVIPLAAAEAFEAEHNGTLDVTSKPEGLSPGTVYYVRVFAENEPEAGVHKRAVSRFQRFETAGPPFVDTFAVHGLLGESMRVMGTVAPNNAPTSEEQTVTIGGGATGGTFTLTFEGETTAPIEFIPHETSDQQTQASRITQALEALPKISQLTAEQKVFVTGSQGGPYTILFLGALGGKAQPLIGCEGPHLTPSGASCSVMETQRGGEEYATQYHVEYVSREDFEASGWAHAKSTPAEDPGSGTIKTEEIEGVRSLVFGTSFVGDTLPGLTPGKAYRYRLVATNTSPGNPVVRGPEQSLTAPAAQVAATGGGGSCPNEQFRTGPSAVLPDCRAYEQITPVDKEGAMEAFRYGGAIGNQGVVIGEDGDHVAYQGLLTHWGTAGNSPYFFTRTSSGWSMVAGAAQPAAGVLDYFPETFSPDLGVFAFRAQSVLWSSLEFEVGPPGGPYKTVASVLLQGGGGQIDGWIAASEDFSKLILQVEGHELITGHPTGTLSGVDLYEYGEGHLRQANVDSGGRTIGTCGARMVNGVEAKGEAGSMQSSRHAVSADGSRVFFEAVPGNDCSEAPHLYVREAGAGQTNDIGAYTFLAANAKGSELLLKKQGEQAEEFFLYDTEKHAFKALFQVPRGEAVQGLSISGDFTTVYFDTYARVGDAPNVVGVPAFYRYHIPDGTLSYLFSNVSELHMTAVSSDGRYAYLEGYVPGLPAGGPDPEHEKMIGEKLAGASQIDSSQVFRFDSAQNLIECVSCASPFASEPKYDSTMFPGAIEAGLSATTNGMPVQAAVSADGNFVFFDTISALVPQDVDGEVEPEYRASSVGGVEYPSRYFSPSSDVYEWRRGGVDGCARVQGCVSLISSGRGGKQVMLLGSTPSGHDVFFTTASQLVPADVDGSIDVYDARIGGGYPPPPPRQTECEGDACSAPVSPLIDTTPSSLTFSGSGNVVQAQAGKPAVKAKKHKAKRMRRRGRRSAHRHRGAHKSRVATAGRRHGR